MLEATNFSTLAGILSGPVDLLMSLAYIEPDLPCTEIPQDNHDESHHYQICQGQKKKEAQLSIVKTFLEKGG